MAAGQCRFAEHVAIASVIAGAEINLPRCDEPATYRVLCRFGSDGIEVELSAEVCGQHEEKFTGAQALVSSVKLRTGVRS